MRAVDIAVDGKVIRAAVPESFLERFTGLRGRQGPMLFRVSSVHGFGMDRPLSVVAIGRDQRVIAVRRLRPGGFVFAKGAMWLLELEEESAAPVVGAQVHFYSVSDDWSPGGVRNSDRQPRRHFRTSRHDAG